jgi:hypothetical protein
MFAQHYHIIDSDEDSDLKEVEVYWNTDSNIVIKEPEDRDGFLNSFLVLTPEMAEDLIHVLSEMVAECND